MPNDPGLRRLALSTLLAAFSGGNAPKWAFRLLDEGLAGHTLSGSNIEDADQIARLTGELRSVRRDVLVAIDEEGGDVTRLAHRTGSPYPGNAALGMVDDPELTRSVYAAIGAGLTRAGINLNLAPSADVNTADDNPVIGTRSFGADALLVARHPAAAVEGLQSSGVAAGGIGPAAVRALAAGADLLRIGAKVDLALVEAVVAEIMPWGLEPHLKRAEQVTVVTTEASPETLAERAGSGPIVVVGRHTHRTEAARTLIERLAARHTVAVVEMGWPSGWRPAGARGFLTTYGVSHASGRAAAEALGLTA